LEETIRSVLLQDYSCLEYVIMDGGSTDGSVNIIRKYAPWLKYWVSKPDGGQAQAIDAGFQCAGGEILAWLNSDDVLEPGALARAAQQFQLHPEAVVIYGDANEIARDGTHLGRSAQVQVCDHQYLVEEYNAIVQPAAFFRRAAYAKAGGLDHTLHWALDYDLWLRLIGLGPFVYIPHTLACTRLYPEAKTGSGSPGMFAEIKTVAERHGGQGLPRKFARLLADIRVAQVTTALRQGDIAAGQELLSEVIAYVPDWRSVSRLAELLAGEVWRRLDQPGEDTRLALRWATELCQGLPEAYVEPKSVERRVLGLLLEGLAFQNYRHGRAAVGLHYAVRAVIQDWRRAANRGLWAMTLRALAKQLLLSTRG
jgi:hypothetical protein